MSENESPWDGDYEMHVDETSEITLGVCPVKKVDGEEVFPYRERCSKMFLSANAFEYESVLGELYKVFTEGGSLIIINEDYPPESPLAINIESREE